MTQNIITQLLIIEIDHQSIAIFVFKHFKHRDRHKAVAVCGQKLVHDVKKNLNIIQTNKDKQTMIKMYVVVLLLVVLIVNAKDQVISCLDNDNEPVDW